MALGACEGEERHDDDHAVDGRDGCEVVAEGVGKERFSMVGERWFVGEGSEFEFVRQLLDEMLDDGVEVFDSSEEGGATGGRDGKETFVYSDQKGFGQEFNRSGEGEMVEEGGKGGMGLGLWGVDADVGKPACLNLRREVHCQQWGAV